MPDPGSSTASTDAAQEDAQPSWPVVSVLAGGCGIVSVATVAMPPAVALPLLAASWLLTLAGVGLWERTLTVAAPHVLAGVLLLAGARAHAIAWDDAWPLIATHAAAGILVLTAAMVTSTSRLLLVAYLLPLAPCGLTAAYAWDHALRHHWSGPLAATAALMATQSIGIVVAVRFAPLRALAIAIGVIGFLLANQAHWHAQQRSLLQLRSAFERASSGISEGGGFSAVDACRWGDEAAPVRVSWVVDLHRPLAEISAQAAALLTLAPRVEKHQVAILVLLLEHEDPGLAGLADLGLLAWQAKGWLQQLERLREAPDASLADRFAQQLQTPGEARALTFCAASTKQLAAIRQAAAFATSEGGLPRTAFLRVARGDLILHQAVESIDASHLASLLEAPGVLQ